MRLFDNFLELLDLEIWVEKSWYIYAPMHHNWFWRLKIRRKKFWPSAEMQ